MSSFQNVNEAFTRQSVSFDETDRSNAILQWMRRQVQLHCMHYYNAEEKILELNCGIGIDAVFFSEQGLKVYATDISEGMLNQVRRKVGSKNLQDKITIQQCSFSELEKIPDRNFN